MTDRPCPFCGGTFLVVHKDMTAAPDYHVQIWCNTCDAMGPSARNEVEAFAKWNGRK